MSCYKPGEAHVTRNVTMQVMTIYNLVGGRQHFRLT